MKLKNFCFTLLFFIVFSFTHAQQSIFSQYYFNPVYSNPAFTGSDYKLSIRSQYRSMWSGLGLGPNTALILAQSPIGLSSSSIGISLMNDYIGLSNSTEASVYYAYRFQTTFGRIAAGTNINFQNYTQDLTSALPKDPGDPALAADINLFLFNLGFGVAWENENGYFGLSTPGILKNAISETSNDPSSETLIQFNLIGAYTIDINSLWKITPSVLFKYLETMPSQMDMQAHLLYNDQFQLDLGYRTNTTYIVGVSYKFLDELQVGYCYDLDNSSFGSTSGGSHELTVGYVFNKSKSE